MMVTVELDREEAALEFRMSQRVSIRLKDEQIERLERFAQRFGKSQSEMGATFLEEAMREAEFEKIEFRDSPLGRQAYMQSSNLAVWEVLMVAQGLGMEPQKVANYFHRPLEWAMAALRYYETYPDEIDTRLEENDQADFEKTKRLLPQARLIEAPDGNDA
jgi:hypothetical protein